MSSNLYEKIYSTFFTAPAISCFGNGSKISQCQNLFPINIRKYQKLPKKFTFHSKLTEDMAHSVTTAERHILNHKVVHGSFDRFLCKIKVPGVIFASKSAVGLKINVKVPK